MISGSRTQAKATPCYASYAGFYRFMTYLAEVGVPRRIETRRVPEYAKNDASRVVAGFFAMKLINEDGFPEDNLHKLVKAFGTNSWNKAVNDILPDAYPFVPLLLRDLTSKQLKDVFVAHIGKDFASLRNAEAFFLGLASEAGIELSPSLAPRADKAVGEAHKWVRLRNLELNRSQTVYQADVVTQGDPETKADEQAHASMESSKYGQNSHHKSSISLSEKLTVLADILQDRGLNSQERAAAMLLVQAVVRDMNPI